jgi:hypothetical protein
LRHAELLFQVLDTPFKSMLYPEQQSKGNQEDAVSGTVFAHGRSGDCGRVTTRLELDPEMAYKFR